MVGIIIFGFGIILFFGNCGFSVFSENTRFTKLLNKCRGLENDGPSKTLSREGYVRQNTNYVSGHLQLGQSVKQKQREKLSLIKAQQYEQDKKSLKKIKNKKERRKSVDLSRLL